MSPDTPISHEDLGAQDWSRIAALAQIDPIVHACFHAHLHQGREHALVEMVVHLAAERARLIQIARDALASQPPPVIIKKS